MRDAKILSIFGAILSCPREPPAPIWESPTPEKGVKVREEPYYSPDALRETGTSKLPVGKRKSPGIYKRSLLFSGLSERTRSVLRCASVLMRERPRKASIDSYSNSLSVPHFSTTGVAQARALVRKNKIYGTLIVLEGGR